MTQPTKDDNYITIKLSTGETLVGIQRAESPTHITIEYPFHLKNYPRFVQGGVVETVTAGPFCSFTADRLFELPKKDILFSKKMHPFAIPFYLSLWHQHERVTRVDKLGRELPPDAPESQAMSEEDIKQRVEMLLGKMQELDLQEGLPYGDEEEEAMLEYLDHKADKKTVH